MKFMVKDKRIQGLHVHCMSIGIFYHYVIHPEIFETQDENFGGWSVGQVDT